MIKSQITIEVEISYRWWLIPYLKILLFFCDLFNLEHDYKKLDRVFEKGIKTRILENGNNI